MTFIQKIKKIFRAVFEEKWLLFTNYYGSDSMGPVSTKVAGPKVCNPINWNPKSTSDPTPITRKKAGQMELIENDDVCFESNLEI